MINQRLENLENLSLTINQTVNNTVNNTTNNNTVNNTIINTFDAKSIKVFSHLVKLNANDQLKAIKFIYDFMSGKRSTNKFDSSDLEKLLPPEIFCPIIKRAGRDTEGNYRYEYLENGKKKFCGTQYVDKVLTNIITDCGLESYNAAIDDSFEKCHPSLNASYQLENYGGIYGNKQSDFCSKMLNYRKIEVEPNHLDKTVDRITTPIFTNT